MNLRKLKSSFTKKQTIIIPSNPNNPKQTNLIKRPQNKDDLDSREREEQMNKGKHTTHNKKDEK